MVFENKVEHAQKTIRQLERVVKDILTLELQLQFSWETMTRKKKEAFHVV